MRLLLSKLYGVASRLALARKQKRQYTSRFPVISVGNISTGGAGKTPLIIWLIEHLQTSIPVIVLTRGYGRRSKADITFRSGEQIPDYNTIGDEPVLIAQALTNGVLGVSANRTRLLQGFETQFDKAVVLLDDGFQHLQIGRSSDIVIVDDNTVNNATLIPHGALRERPSSLQRATIIVATSDKAERFARQYKADGAHVFRMMDTHPFVTDVQGMDRIIPPGARVLLVTGIANPERVVSTLNMLNVGVLKHLKFDDHHMYTMGDAESINRLRTANEITHVVTTSKDAVKLREYEHVLGDLLVVHRHIDFSDRDGFLQEVMSIAQS